MNKPKEIIPIFFSADDGYAPYLGVALHSLIQNASQDYEYHVTVLTEKLSEENRDKIAALANDTVSIRFVGMEERLSGIHQGEGNLLRADYFTLTIFFRLFIPAMFPQYDKVLYLDSDIIVTGDISELYNTDIGDNLIGAAPDFSIVDIPELVLFMERAMGLGKYEYINSGILLMDAKKLREVELDKRFLLLMNTYRFDCIAPDQDYLNAMCKGKIFYLSHEWDAMPVKTRPPMENPKLIHYNLYDKPWCYSGVQYEEYFWKYARETIFYQQILDFKAQYTQAAMQEDSEHMAQLLSNAVKIACSPRNFRVVFEEEGEKRL